MAAMDIEQWRSQHDRWAKRVKENFPSGKQALSNAITAAQERLSLPMGALEIGNLSSGTQPASSFLLPLEDPVLYSTDPVKMAKLQAGLEQANKEVAIARRRSDAAEQMTKLQEAEVAAAAAAGDSAAKQAAEERLLEACVCTHVQTCVSVYTCLHTQGVYTHVCTQAQKAAAAVKLQAAQRGKIERALASEMRAEAAKAAIAEAAEEGDNSDDTGDDDEFSSDAVDMTALERKISASNMERLRQSCRRTSSFLLDRGELDAPTRNLRRRLLSEALSLPVLSESDIAAKTKPSPDAKAMAHERLLDQLTADDWQSNGDTELTSQKSIQDEQSSDSQATTIEMFPHIFLLNYHRCYTGEQLLAGLAARCAHAHAPVYSHVNTRLRVMYIHVHARKGYTCKIAHINAQASSQVNKHRLCVVYV